jgi:hypothetical protein
MRDRDYLLALPDEEVAQRLSGTVGEAVGGDDDPLRDSLAQGRSAMPSSPVSTGEKLRCMLPRRLSRRRRFRRSQHRQRRLRQSLGIAAAAS